MREVTINGAPTDCFERGRGPPVVLAHGAPSDYRVRRPHCEALAARYRAIAYTLRHFGTRDWQPGWPALSIRTHADDLKALLRDAVAEPAHVVGWSYGAHVALTAAHEAPELFLSLFVYEPGVPTYVADEAELTEFAADAERMFGPVFAAVERGDDEAAVRALLDGGSGQREGYFDSQSPERRRVQLDSARVLPLLLTAPPPPALSCADLAGLPMPARVARGERTRPFFGVVSRAAARCVPGRHAAVPGAAHMWPEERPHELAALVERFIESLPAAR